MKNPLTPEELGALFQEIESEPTGKLSELAKVAGLNLAEDYVGVDLSDEDLSEDDLSGADFSFSNLRNVNLKDTNLANSNLSGANLTGANLSGANLSGANLTGANLLLVQAIETNFKEANLTGACIEDWHINFHTSFENVKCDYIFLRTIGNKKEKFIFKERRPLKENTYFEPGDFEKLIRKSQETIDLIFRNGINWQAFPNHHKQYKAFDNKGHGSSVVKQISLKNSLSKDKFKNLVETLSGRRNQLEGRSTIDSVQESLVELGLSDVLRKNDIEEISKQVSREFKKRQWKNYLNFALILIIFVAPLAAFGSYKLRQVEKLQANRTELKNQLEDYQIAKDELEKRVQKINNENKYSTTFTTASTEAILIKIAEITEIPATSFEAQGLIYELKGCQKSNVGSISQTISCTLLITSKRENVEFYLYSNSGGRKSRIFEADKKYLATSVKLGTNSDTSYVKSNLIKDVPIEATITFDNVQLQVNKIEGLQISSLLRSSYYKNDIKVEFRNISLSEN
ncbi:MAG: pentapeptide repeat-containing protein [Okeania sp. SIO3B5]|uniref:pentapeptide repeat-containing protein n=1 Tax=Okeania sp. SIO3B5 TaxID=2607811 RepID=UPI0014018050|nr:pentapeptide repeat-containing protein [Okeania sp. SIO3B5]NEO56379.1 pentapeptide repeat-containing protein [Okeania sp. SIO3B5]